VPRARAQDPPTDPEKAPPTPDPARNLVFRTLTRQARRFPDLAIGGIDESRDAPAGPLDPRDAALAHAIYDAVIRRWLTLEHVLAAFVTRPLADLEPAMRAVLLGGAAQLLLLDRVPAHAAINSAVEWAKRRINPGAGGLANAVLRKVATLRAAESPESPPARRDRYTDRRDELPLSDGSALGLTREILPPDDLSRLSIATSHPVDLLRAWAASMPLREVRRLALHSLAAPPVILNTAHASASNGDAAHGLGSLTAAGLITPHETPGHHVFLGSHSQLAALLAARSDLWVQDPASSLAVESAADLGRIRVVLDLCAGQGTKTRQLAAAFPEAEIVATDIDSARRRTLAPVFAGHPRVRVVEPPQLRDRWLAAADLILLDVPCSNSGVLARRPEARYRFSPQTLASLTATQRQIIADSIPLLRAGEGGPRGRILYSTCSLEPQENEHQAAWAARWHAFKSARERRRLPSAGPGEPATSYSDGSFAVLLQ
jgi:16S rRNA (cytosine967-C5)-methyltransferase